MILHNNIISQTILSNCLILLTPLRNRFTSIFIWPQLLLLNSLLSCTAHCFHLPILYKKIWLWLISRNNSGIFCLISIPKFTPPAILASPIRIVKSSDDLLYSWLSLIYLCTSSLQHSKIVCKRLIADDFLFVDVLIAYKQDTSLYQIK